MAPYIRPVAREALFKSGPPVTSGELTFVLTNTINAYVLKHGLAFQNIAEVLGALEATKLEFYRRIVAPHEDAKCIKNGDVYPPELLPRKDQ